MCPGLPAMLARDRVRTGLRLRWALAGAMLLVLAVLPVWRGASETREREREAAQQQAEDRADELLMQQVNASLSRGVPRAMEPLLGMTVVKGEDQ